METKTVPAPTDAPPRALHRFTIEEYERLTKIGFFNPGDRSELIDASIRTLQRDLLEEAVIVSFVIVIFLFHFRSALIAILALPIAVLVSFIPMYLLGVSCMTGTVSEVSDISGF